MYEIGGSEKFVMVLHYFCPNTDQHLVFVPASKLHLELMYSVSLYQVQIQHNDLIKY